MQIKKELNDLLWEIERVNGEKSKDFIFRLKEKIVASMSEEEQDVMYKIFDTYLKQRDKETDYYANF